MDRTMRRPLLIVAVVFLGLYLLSHNYFGYFSFGYVPWTKWAMLALGLWIVFGLCSSRSRSRYRRPYRGIDSGRGSFYQSSHDQSAIHNKLDQLQEELAELRSHRSVAKNADADLDRRFADLTDRIITLEKIVTDRRYDLDEKIRKL